MNKFSDVFRAHGEAERAFKRRCGRLDRKDRALRAELAEIGKKRAGLKLPSYIDGIIRPVAEAIAASMPDRTFEILGPFGMCGEVSVHFIKKSATGDDRLSDANCMSLTFVDGGAGLRDYTRSSGEYPK